MHSVEQKCVLNFPPYFFAAILLKSPNCNGERFHFGSAHSLATLFFPPAPALFFRGSLSFPEPVQAPKLVPNDSRLFPFSAVGGRTREADDSQP